MEHSFPFNSVNHDRKYFAEDFARYFKPLFSNGVFSSSSTNLQVTADGTGMKVSVQPGDGARINGIGYDNDSAIYFTLANADGATNRTDRIVIRWSKADRKISAAAKQGEYATTPISPALQRDADIYELALADVYVGAGVTSITQADITDLRPDSDLCGWINSLITVDSKTLYDQFTAQFNNWFNHLKGTLDGDAAGHLQNEIDNEGIQTYTHAKNGTVHVLTGSGPIGRFQATADYVGDDTFAVNGSAVPATLQDGSALPHEFFTSGKWVQFFFDGSQLNFKSAGGEGSLNVYCQPNLLTDKFDGILLQTSAKETLKKIIFDSSIWSSGSWQNPSEVPNLPTLRNYGACTVVDNKAYIFGGLSDTTSDTAQSSALCYDPQTKVYIALANLPYPIRYHCCAAVGHKIYIFGGFINNNVQHTYVFVYDIDTNTYETRNNSVSGLIGCSCVASGPYIYFINSTSRRYNTEDNTWTVLASGGQNGDSALFNNTIYTFGQDNGDSGYSKTSIKYDIAANTFSKISDMPEFKMYAVCCTVDDKIYHLGGSNSTTDSYGFSIDTCYTYAPATDSYTQIASMPEKRGCLSNMSAFLTNKILAFGGALNANNLKYDANTQTVASYMLQAKQYDQSPAVVIIWNQLGGLLHTVIMKHKLADIPINFLNVALFKNGEVTFPALYVGDGSAWNLKRSAS